MLFSQAPVAIDEAMVVVAVMGMVEVIIVATVTVLELPDPQRSS